MLSYNTKTNEPIIFTKKSYNEFNKKLSLKQMMIASAVQPIYFQPAEYKDIGTFVSGDVVSLDPSLFAYTFVIDELKKAPESVRIVSVGSTDIKSRKLSNDHE